MRKVTNNSALAPARGGVDNHQHDVLVWGGGQWWVIQLVLSGIITLDLRYLIAVDLDSV